MLMSNIIITILLLLVLPFSLLNTQNQRKSLLLPQWMILPGHCLCLFWTGLANWDHGRAGQSVADWLSSPVKFPV